MKTIIEKIQKSIREKRIENINPQVIILNQNQQKELAGELSEQIAISPETRTNRILGLHIIADEREIIRSEELNET